MSAGNHRRTGMVVLYLAIFVVIILTILATIYYSTVRQEQATAYKYERGEQLRLIAEMAMDEAFSRLSEQTLDAGSPQGKLFLESPAVGFTPIALPLVEALLKQRPAGSFIPHVEAGFRIIDTREADSRGRRYYGKERIGIVEIQVNSAYQSATTGTVSAAFQLVRHHDFKVACLVSASVGSPSRAGYAPNALLDYALLLRNGTEEFIRSKAETLNPERVRVQILQKQVTDPKRRGRVYVGGSGAGSSKSVFVNTEERFRKVLPSLNPAPLVVETVDRDQCLKLIPRLKSELEKAAAEQAAKAKTSKEEIMKKIMAGLANLKGVFTLRLEPVNKASGTSKLDICEERVRRYLRNAPSAEPWEGNVEKGLEILSDDPALVADPAYADSVLEGRFRQRFLRFVAFHLDTSGLSKEFQEGFKDLDDFFPCAPMPSPEPSKEIIRDFLKELAVLQSSRSASGHSLLSAYDTRFLFKGGQSYDPAQNDTLTFAQPSFFSRVGSISDTRAVLYDHPSLWTRGFKNLKALKKAGIVIDEAGGQRLNLRGITWVEESLVLGEGGVPVTYSGQGALMLEPGKTLTIKGKLQRGAADDLCILGVRDSRIVIDTEQTIEAALVSLGETGRGSVQVTKKLDLKGALIADILETGDWPRDVIHQIQYDQALRRSDDLYKITLNTGITFRRQNEGEP